MAISLSKEMLSSPAGICRSVDRSCADRILGEHDLRNVVGSFCNPVGHAMASCCLTRGFERVCPDQRAQLPKAGVLLPGILAGDFTAAAAGYHQPVLVAKNDTQTGHP